MSISKFLEERSGGNCELCSQDGNLNEYIVSPKEDTVAICSNCLTKINAADFQDEAHWQCLSGSIWNEAPAVQALSYRILARSGAAWANEIVEGMDINEDIVDWAMHQEAGNLVHKDSNGTILAHGDSVVLIQNLNVKGTNFIAPKGTVVRKIRLVHDNDEHIEGKVNGDTIVILTKFVRKSV